MLYLALALVIVAGVLFWQARQKRQAIGLPAGRIIYSDTKSWGAVEQPIYDPELSLVGKPHYLVEQNGQLIPVEVKSSQVGQAPYDAHIYQLAAYCLLVHRHYGKRPAYGILHYANHTFAIDYTPQLERSILELLVEIHSLERKKQIHRSHENLQRCKACGFRTTCDQKLM